MVVSAGRLVAVTDSFACVVGSVPISWKKRFSDVVAVAIVVAQRHRHDDRGVELRHERGGLSRRQRSAERDAGDVHGADVAQLLLGEQVTDLAEVDRVNPIELDDERGLLARLGAPRVVTIGPNSRDEDLLDLVLARPVEDERVVETRREKRQAVARGASPWRAPADDRRDG